MSLYLFNSLNKKKEEFIDPNKKTIKWYTCGPTVYDKSHLGHARTFISLDVIRRTMMYLGYDIMYVMNITDIDDKIIHRVQENSGFGKYISEIENKIFSGNFDILKRIRALFEDDHDKFDNIEHLVKNSKIEGLHGFLGDKKYKTHLLKMFYDDVEINEKEYYELTQNMEQKFWEDMDSLDVMYPNVITRATEYIPKIIAYIEDLEKKGFAYESGGSVYFDSQEFKKKGYNFDQFNRFQDTEYTESSFISDKKHKHDFVLWKKAKAGEIKFDSKWGKGRIGWHSECVVMASDILGSHFDIHSGGIDLEFPHHNNEIVQALAHDESHVWADQFLHIGHLNINGDKMSKSLFNFVTIEDYLENTGTSRQLRLLFLIHRWDTQLDFCEATFNEAVQTDKRIVDYFENMEFSRKNTSLKNTLEKSDIEFNDYLFKANIMMENYLRDNVNTSFVIKQILEIINKTYVYMQNQHNISIVLKGELYIKKLLNVFGLDYSIKPKESGNSEKWIDSCVSLRYDVRKTLIENKKHIGKEAFKKLFNVIDDYRDNQIKQLGIKLEDKGKDEPTKWSYI